MERHHERVRASQFGVRCALICSSTPLSVPELSTVAIARALNFYAPNAAMQPTSDLESARKVAAEHPRSIDDDSKTVVVGWLMMQAVSCSSDWP